MREFNYPIYVGTGKLGGHSLLPDDEGWVVSHVNLDGTVNSGRLERTARWIANMGGNFTIDFSWAHTLHAWNVLSPFWRSGRDPGAITSWNDKFFVTQYMTATTYRSYGITYAYHLFEHCHTKRPEVGRFGPWNSFDDHFYGSDAQATRNDYLKRFVSTTLNTGMIYSVCNEPKPGQSQMLADVIFELHKLGVPWERILLPIDAYLKGSRPYADDYMKIRKILSVRLKISDKEMGGILKKKCLSTIHNAYKNTDDFFGPNYKSFAERPVIFDFDGDRPRRTSGEAYVYAKEVIEKRFIAFMDGKIHFHTVLGKTRTDPLTSLKGIVDACIDVAGYNPNPEHYKHYPETLFPGGWRELPPVEPPVTGAKEQLGIIAERYRELGDEIVKLGGLI